MDKELKNLREKAGDLSDIVLEKKSKTSRVGTKKWILTIASAIVLFLIVLLVLKMLKGSNSVEDTTDKIANIDNSIEQITKEEPVAEKSEDENLFKKEPIIDESSETDAKFEEMVRKLKEQESITQKLQAKDEKKEEKNTTTQIKPQEIKTITQTSTEVPVITTKSAEEQHIKPVEKKVVTIHQEKPKPKTSPKPKHQVKRSVKETFKHISKPTIKGYFIQVGATSRSFPDRRFLSKIKNAGFDYIVHTVYVNGKKIKKVLVGPYSSKTEANSALGRVKSSINPSAFVYRLK